MNWCLRSPDCGSTDDQVVEKAFYSHPSALAIVLYLPDPPIALQSITRDVPFSRRLSRIATGCPFETAWKFCRLARWGLSLSYDHTCLETDALADLPARSDADCGDRAAHKRVSSRTVSQCAAHPEG